MVRSGVEHLLAQLRQTDASSQALLTALEAELAPWFARLTGSKTLPIFTPVIGEWSGTKLIFLPDADRIRMSLYVELALTLTYPDAVHSTIICMLGISNFVGENLEDCTISRATALTLWGMRKLPVKSRLWRALRLPIAQEILVKFAEDAPYALVSNDVPDHLKTRPFVNAATADKKAFVEFIAGSYYMRHFSEYVDELVRNNTEHDDWIEFVFGVMMKHRMSPKTPLGQIRRTLGARYSDSLGGNWRRFYKWINPVAAIATSKLVPPYLDELGEWTIQRREPGSDIWHIMRQNLSSYAVTNHEVWQRHIATAHARHYFALIVLQQPDGCNDGYFTVRAETPRVARFFGIASRLPIELQQVLAQLMAGRSGTTLPALSATILHWALDPR